MNKMAANTYVCTAHTGRMKMHLKCNNKNDNGIIILKRKKGTTQQQAAGSGAHFMPLTAAGQRWKVCYIICSSLIFIVCGLAAAVTG